MAKHDHLLGRIHHFIDPYRITNAKNFKLSDIDPSDTGPLTSGKKQQAKELLETGIDFLAEQQEMLYAQDFWALLRVTRGSGSNLRQVLSYVLVNLVIYLGMRFLRW